MTELLHPPESYRDEEEPRERDDLKKLTESLRDELSTVQLDHDTADKAIRNLVEASAALAERFSLIGEAIEAEEKRTGRKDAELMKCQKTIAEAMQADREEHMRLTETANAAVKRHTELMEAMKEFSRLVTTRGGQA